MTRVHIRWLISRDLPAVLAIDAASFDRPWSENRFLRHLHQRNCIGMVAVVPRVEADEEIVGFMVFTLEHDSIDLRRLAVHPSWRRESVGRQLVAKLVGKLSEHRRPLLATVVREGNLAAQLWLRACGLRACEVVRGHYGDTGEDGYLFRWAAVPSGRVEWAAQAQHGG